MGQNWVSVLVVLFVVPGPRLPAAVAEFMSADAGDAIAALIFLNNDSADAFTIAEIELKEVNLKCVTLSRMLDEKTVTAKPFLAAIADHYPF